MENLITPYQWNPFFEKIKEFGLTFVDNKKCLESSRLRGDTHTIIHRLIKDEIPTWIRQGIPEDIIVLQIFAIEPDTVGLIHKDGVDRLCAFNIPILNCELGSMDWFSTSDFSIYSVENNYTTIRVTNEQIKNGKSSETVPIFSTLVTQPALVNTDTWHRVDNRGMPSFRWMLSLRFKNNPSFEIVQEKLNNAFK
jgi:hypothetical protein